MLVINKYDPLTLAKYVQEKNMVDLQEWKWTRNYLNNNNNINRITTDNNYDE